MRKLDEQFEAEKGKWKEQRRRGNEVAMKNTKTGEIRKSVVDVEGQKRGDYLQGIGKDRDAFLQTYGYLPDVDRRETNKYLAKKGIKIPRPR